MSSWYFQYDNLVKHTLRKNSILETNIILKKGEKEGNPCIILAANPEIETFVQNRRAKKIIIV